MSPAVLRVTVRHVAGGVGHVQRADAGDQQGESEGQRVVALGLPEDGEERRRRHRHRQARGGGGSDLAEQPDGDGTDGGDRRRDRPDDGQFG